MKAYLNLVQNVLDNGVWKENRTGVKTLSNFAEFYKVDLSKGFPAAHHKKSVFPVGHSWNFSGTFEGKITSNGSG
jgi:thymidylate synthase